MVDSTSLIIATSVVQTVVITLTLAVFIFQFRSQEKSIKESAVQTVMGRYTDYVRMLVEKPELGRILLVAEGLAVPDGDGQPDPLSPEDETLFAYILMGYGIFEEVFSLYKKGWIDEETWSQWATFLKRLTGHPLFRRIHRMTSGTFDKDFQNLITKMIGQSEGDAPTGK